MELRVGVIRARKHPDHAIKEIAIPVCYGVLEYLLPTPPGLPGLLLRYCSGHCCSSDVAAARGDGDGPSRWVGILYDASCGEIVTEPRRLLMSPASSTFGVWQWL